jgi:hypothetical protein
MVKIVKKVNDDKYFDTEGVNSVAKSLYMSINCSLVGHHLTIAKYSRIKAALRRHPDSNYKTK